MSEWTIYEQAAFVLFVFGIGFLLGHAAGSWRGEE